MTSRAKRFVGGLIGVLVLCGAFGAFAAPAFATQLRTYDSQITGLVHPEALSVGPADELWVSDIGVGEVYRYNPYPSQAKLEIRTGHLVWGGSQQAHSIAFSGVNDFLYAATDEEEHGAGYAVSASYPTFGIFDNFDQVYLTNNFGEAIYQHWVAVDNNPQDDAYGRVYRYSANYSSGGSRIEMLNGYGEPVPFTGSASYIEGNKITGTSSGEFSSFAAGARQPEMPGITVDAEGNIWVVDVEEKAIHEFAPSGIFLQTITRASSGAPETTTNPEGSHPYGAHAGLAGIAVDPTNGDVVVSNTAGGVLYEFSPRGKYLGQIDGSETPAGNFKFRCRNVENGFAPYCATRTTGLAFDSQGHLYVTDGENHVVDIFEPRPAQPTIAYKPYDNPTPTSVTLHALVGLNGGGNVTDCKILYGPTKSYGSSKDCEPEKTFGSDREVSAQITTGLSAETTYHYAIEVSNANATRVGIDQTFTPHKVLSLRADPATGVTSSGATLHGSFVGNGAHTTYWFEYGRSTAYGSTVPLPAPPGADAGSPVGPGRTNVNEIAIGGLSPVTRYHYRIVAENGSKSLSEDQSFRTLPLLPQAKTEAVTKVHSESAMLHGQVSPGGADTTYSFEFGTEKCSEVPDPCSGPPTNIHAGSNLGFHSVSRLISGLEVSTHYYYRTVAVNSVGTAYGPDRAFTTHPFSAELKDSCPNALARQQTGAALLSDCRGYELVSSSHAGGYDVESTLVPGQRPFDGYPRAQDRVLYGIHNGAIPGVPGNPTNRGVDPYVATRGNEGWTTSYVGIPANNPNATSPFASTLLEADPSLDSFVFGGPDICSPCFADGSTGVPLHLPSGELVQGMKGSEEPLVPASSDGLVKKSLSADGKHLVFSSTTKLEEGGNDSTGDVSIYERDLETDMTQVVSTDPTGDPLACLQGTGNCHATTNPAGIAELDISEDGSRVITGQRVSTDVNGNNYFHLYMHMSGNPEAVDLTPGASALFDGMTEDGSKVFFTTKDHLGGGDADVSADIYEAAVDGGGSVSRRLVTTHEGIVSNDDGCVPPGFPTTWNAASGDGKCSAVAFAGGAGLASEDGTFYFLSPEFLDSAAQAEGEEDQPNLYVVKPGGDPEFVATIDTSVGKPAPAADYLPGTSKILLTGLERAESIAVDQNSGDIYVTEAETGEVSRWKPNGTADDFSSLGSNRITGQNLGFSEGQVAVDSSGSPFKGDFYVTTKSAVNVFSEDGQQLGALTGFSEACGVAVDQSNGDVYVGNYGFPSEIIRFRPISAEAPVTNASYEAAGGITTSLFVCNVDASAEGHVYSWNYFGGEIEQFLSSSFKKPFPAGSGKPIASGVNAQSDPVHGDLFIDGESKISRYDPKGSKIEEFGSGAISSSHGIGVNGTTGHVYATSGGNSVVDFQGVSVSAPIDHPAVVHAIKQAGTHEYGDFQVTPSGDYATFATRQPLEANYENHGHSEVYRYDTGNGALDCVSCPLTNSLAAGDAALASHGLSVSSDGRVFFDTEEPLALRDDNGRKDVYEWEEEGVGPEPGKCDEDNPTLFLTGVCVSLISSGTSQFDSSLLSTSASGKDVYFFTHDSLAHGDNNGPLAKIYDARTEGGVFNVPPAALCAASDECHGPGTQAAPPPPIGTKAGSPGNPSAVKPCKKGFVMKHGKCVRRKHKSRTHRRTR